MHKYVYLYCTRLIISTEKTLEHQTQSVSITLNIIVLQTSNFKVIFTHTQAFYRTFCFNNIIRCNPLFLPIYIQPRYFDITNDIV